VKPTIVICEDDFDLGRFLCDFLSDIQYNVVLTSCAEELDLTCSSLSPDAVILDVQLPGEDGLSIAKRYHSTRPNLPIIMMSVNANDQNQAVAYDNGAMLFLPKPFQPAALKALLTGLFKLQFPDKNGDIYLKTSESCLRHNNVSVALTRREAKVLQFLILRSPAVVETYELMESISIDQDELPSKSSIEVLISRLRKKLKDNNIDREQINIQSEHGVGYSLHGRISLAE